MWHALPKNGDEVRWRRERPGAWQWKCEVDACNEHVGQGGGQPHFHGDSFGCQYTAADYTSVDMHPPIIGWSYDGYDIRGRHLSESAPGYNAPLLDDCGGHVHDSDTEALGYHYHTQVRGHGQENCGLATQHGRRRLPRVAR